ncbi:MAG: class I SAM-dependent methyltransferase [Acidobacteriota bacterium]
MIPYRDFYYPLNVFMHILTLEEGEVRYLHYGLFERPDESIAVAQERSTKLLLSRLPPPPARLLEVGAGLGTTLARLARLGYDAQGITPDEKQVAMARGGVTLSSFEAFEGAPFDVILFQESSQYIDSETLFAKARDLAPRVVVLDEFAMQPLDEPGALRPLDGFLRAAAANGFSVAEDIDLSAKAAPTIDYFRVRLPRYREALIADLGLTGQQVDDLVEGGERYSNRYYSGVYVYRLLDLRR